MDQHRNVLATDRRKADRTQRQKSLEELHQLVDRLHAMKPEYQKLIAGAQQNLQDARLLQREIDALVVSHER